MKKIFFCCVLIAGVVYSSFSQTCNADTSCSFTQIVCSSNQSNGCVGESYNQVISVAVPSTILLGTTTLALTRIRLDSLIGLPPGLVKDTCNPGTCSFMGGTRGCILINGTPTTPGSYPLTAKVRITIALFINVDTVFSAGTIVIDPKDCAGVCAGTASIDACNRCSGGTTGKLPNCADTDPCTVDACNGVGGCINTPIVCYVNISGKIISEKGDSIPGVIVSLSGSDTQKDTTGINGVYSFDVPKGGSYTVTPAKNNDVTKSGGLSAIDLGLIQKHILIIDTLDTPYRIIASDVNSSNSVSAADIGLTKRVILSIDTTFPGGKLWTFVKSDFIFTDPINLSLVEKTRTLNNVLVNQINQNFIGMKLGDANSSWNPLIP